MGKCIVKQKTMPTHLMCYKQFMACMLGIHTSISYNHDNADISTEHDAPTQYSIIGYTCSTLGMINEVKHVLYSTQYFFPTSFYLLVS